MKRGDRVSWSYQGTRTFGVITSIGGERATIPTQAKNRNPRFTWTVKP